MNKAKVGIIAAVAVVVLAVGGTWLYINVIKDEAPEELTLGGTDRDSDSDTDRTTTTAATTGETDAPAADGSVDGEWAATGDSVVGYRAKEILFGQDTEGVGRTSDVTGTMTITGSTVEAAEFEADLTTVKSDSGNRDNQFQGRIMDTDQFPTATFELTTPIDFGSVPADGVEITATAEGELTLRGTTRPVTLEMTALREGDTISVLTTYDVVFDDWGIPDPSFGPAQVEANALLEIKLVFERA